MTRSRRLGGWADAAMIVPWTMYLGYGDTRLLERQYASMKAWVDYMRREAGDDEPLDARGFHFGDWLAFATTRSDYPGRDDRQGPDRHGVLRLLDRPAARAAAVLGKQEDAADYARAPAEDQGGVPDASS